MVRYPKLLFESIILAHVSWRLFPRWWRTLRIVLDSKHTRLKSITPCGDHLCSNRIEPSPHSKGYRGQMCILFIPSLLHPFIIATWNRFQWGRGAPAVVYLCADLSRRSREEKEREKRRKRMWGEKRGMTDLSGCLRITQCWPQWNLFQVSIGYSRVQQQDISFDVDSRLKLCQAQDPASSCVTDSCSSYSKCQRYSSSCRNSCLLINVKTADVAAKEIIPF